MNEFIFFTQSLLIIGFCFGAFKLGKEALITWISLQALIANLFVLKQMSLFGLDVTASDVYVIGSLLGLNLLQEYFSRDEAVKATKICFYFMVFFTLISQLHLAYTPNLHDNSQTAFEILLTPSPRLLIASMSVFFIIQQIDIRFFAFLKKKLPNLNFAFRTCLTLILSQFLDTVLFSFAGLYGIVESVIDIIFMSFLIKIITIICFTLCMRSIKHENALSL